MERENLKSYLAGISHSVGNGMAGFSHAPACCLSKLRSSLEAGKKQLRVWVERVCGMAEILLYPSLGAPLVLLSSSYRKSDSSLRYDGNLMEVSWRSLGVSTGVYASNDVFVMADEADLIASYTYVHEAMNISRTASFTKIILLTLCPLILL